ncbi:MAG: type II toxin-antitoxin system VapC family toxin [Alphaproteobacteria bacterium]|jgi:hypothetical protein|nr:type II toxin-antitoxin system VapC family toxin [Thalassospira sp.]MCE2964414.1 type II toxin-antitoxin system VapC family toxin [Alphaproteobacteria bacterium]
MFILDTNVLSELIKPQGDQVVLTWFARQSRSALYSTTINLAEIIFGIARLPHGKKKQNLDKNFSLWQKSGFENKFLSFDVDAACYFGLLKIKHKSHGHNVSTEDLQIAAITHAHNATLITRNTKDFASCGIALINPWDMMRP